MISLGPKWFGRGWIFWDFFKRTKKFNLNIKLDPLCNICVAVNTFRVNLSLMIHTNTIIIIITLCMRERKNKNRNIFSVENLLLNDLISKWILQSLFSEFFYIFTEQEGHWQQSKFMTFVDKPSQRSLSNWKFNLISRDVTFFQFSML